jgi:hypothetical protein
MTIGTGSDGLPKIFVRVEHGLYRPARLAEVSTEAAPSVVAAAAAGAPDVLLVTCVKTKRSVPAAAKDLYVSELFKRQRVYAERAGVPWFILSAEYGLLRPDDWISPYERYLPDCTRDYQRAWGTWVAQKLELLTGGLRGSTVEIHASTLYMSCLTPELERLGARVTAPVAGLAHGQRLSWYGDRAAVNDAPPESDANPPSSDLLIEALVATLLDVASARRPEELRALGRAQLSRPGMYSWWVDEAGAVDLSVGLERSVSPGLIYAGQAGATRWPSGRRSANTLWARLIGMHLDGPANFSTFRLTLGSILLGPLQMRHVDDPALTRWMEAHLRVVTAPVNDADTLMEVESSVLARLDPPLNLSGRPSTPVRRQLSVLRKLAKGGSDG